MYSVFLVEDEILIRDGLKTSFPWESYGFTYVGDAADGEVALPLIRQSKPDVIITDIKMPFMDGIALSKIVKKELPDTHIIIISGFDDFTYAKEAISIGVDDYLLKPITKDKLGEVMADVKDKLDKATEQGNYYDKYRQESQEYEQFARVKFFNQLIAGTLSVSEVYEKSAELNIALDASCYNLVLLAVSPIEGANKEQGYSKHMARLSDQLTQYFMCCPEYIVFHWNMDTYAIIIKGDDASIKELTANCIDNITRRCQIYDDEVAWFVAEGSQIKRFSDFAEAAALANRKLSLRYMRQDVHVFTDEDLKQASRGNAGNDSVVIDQRLVGLFLDSAMTEEIDGFLKNMIAGDTEKSLDSLLFCQYFAMTMYMCVCDHIRKMGSKPENVLPDTIRNDLQTATKDTVLELVHMMFEAAIGLRDGEKQEKYKGQLSLAMEYVKEHYADSGLSLNEVAKEVNISPSYLSAMFSREAKTTFVEYMTSCRMKEAEKLLIETDYKSAVIAEKVGYKDPHYFSYIFKKTYGMSPKEFRTDRR